MTETTSTAKNYTLTLLANNEPEIDLDELSCIIQQLEAISMGWGHDWGKTFIKEETQIMKVMEWKNPAFDFLNNPKENIYNLKDGEPI